MGLEKAVLRRRQRKSILKDTIRLGKALFDIAANELEMSAQIGPFDRLQFSQISKAGLWKLDRIMNQGRVGLKRFLNIEHRRQFFVIDFDQTEGGLRGIRCE